MNIDDDILALCYLYKEGDEENKVLLSREKLYVVHHKRTHEYEMANIKGLDFNHRKIMLPLIVGGIMASLSMIALFKDYFDPYIVAVVWITGAGLFYFGWSGKLFFTVTTKIKDYDFAVPAATENMQAFIDFIVEAGLPWGKGDLANFVFYMVLDLSVWESQPTESAFIQLPEKPYKAFLPGQLHRKDLHHAAIIGFSPIKAFVEIRFLKDPSTGKLSPFLMADLNRDAIIKTEIRE